MTFSSAHLSDQQQPQEETDHSDGQDQRLSGVRPPQAPWQQVGDGCGQAFNVCELGTQDPPGLAYP